MPLPPTALKGHPNANNDHISRNRRANTANTTILTLLRAYLPYLHWSLTPPPPLTMKSTNSHPIFSSYILTSTTLSAKRTCLSTTSP